jgi:galactokinase
MASTTVVFPKTKFELEFNQGSQYSDEERDAISRVFESGAVSCGNEVLSFEKEFAEFIHTRYAIAVGNGSDGLEIALRAVIKASPKSQGSPEVVVPAVSWISTAGAAALAGAKVIFADVKNPTVCVDPESIKQLVTPNTVAVVVVHLFGRPVDGLPELAAWLNARDIYLVEDCAHAVGAVDFNGTHCGSIGDVGVFSFHQQKNMVTLGEGGMCVTSDPKLRELMVGFRSVCAMSYDPKGKYLALDAESHPMGKRYWMMDFADHGHNYRMIDMQAAVGREQLKKVLGWNRRRAEIARTLASELSSLPGLRVADVEESGAMVHAWHIFHVLVTDEFPLGKEDFMWALLQEFSIKTWNHYCPMHLATSFRTQGLGKAGDCPVAEELFEQYVSLPLHPRLTDEAVQYMVDAIRQLSRRPYVPRSGPAPLLNALLALTQPKNVSYKSEAAEQQCEAFEDMVKSAVVDGFFTTQSSPVCIARAPGRLDLMGGNDDYTGGLVFECTIAEGTFVAVQSKPSSAVITVRNRQLCAEDITVPVSILRDSSVTADSLAAFLKSAFPQSRWQLYVIGVFLWLQMRFPSHMFGDGSTGLSLLVWSRVPLNRGVSSSASVEVAVMKAAAHAYGISLSGETLATACQWVENQVCSSACGLMDQMAVTIGTPFMAMRCQPAVICQAPPLPADLTVYALDSGVSHEVSGIEYEAARAAAFMGYKIICLLEGLEVVEEEKSEIPRFTDSRYRGYLANMSPSVFSRCYENTLPESISGQEFLDKYGAHVDPATSILPDHVYRVRANTKYAVLENNRVTLFYQLLKGCSQSGSDSMQDTYIQLGELMYQSHDAYTECGLGSGATSSIVTLVQDLGPSSGLFGAKITGGGAGGTVAILGLKSAHDTFKTSVVDVYAAMRKDISSEPPYVFVGSSMSSDTFGIREFQC